MNKILHEDINEFVKNFALGKELKDSSFLITGSTGLIGSILIHCLLALKENIRIVAPVRNKEKARNMFSTDEQIEFVECDLISYDYNQLGYVDYVIHCAAPTASKFFVKHPVETIDIIYSISSSLLKYSVLHKVKGFLYLSSLEVYGGLNSEELITEDMQGYLDISDIRSSYPMAKRMVENLCCSYVKEYGVSAKIARLTQTTGAGISKDDNRVIAQFARCGIEGKDIVLHTTGESARPYCYTIDAISAMLYILLKGENGSVYNIANEKTYISAKDLAFWVKEHINNSINVKIQLNDNMGYASTSKLLLSTAKLQQLGWYARYELDEVFVKLSKYLQ